MNHPAIHLTINGHRFALSKAEALRLKELVNMATSHDTVTGPHTAGKAHAIQLSATASAESHFSFFDGMASDMQKTDC